MAGKDLRPESGCDKGEQLMRRIFVTCVNLGIIAGATSAGAAICDVSLTGREASACNTCYEWGYQYDEAECKKFENSSYTYLVRCPLRQSQVWCMEASKCSATPVSGDACSDEARESGAYQMKGYCDAEDGTRYCRYTNESCNKGWFDGRFTAEQNTGTSELCCTAGWDYEVSASGAVCALHECTVTDENGEEATVSAANETTFRKYYPEPDTAFMRSEIGSYEKCTSGTLTGWRYKECGLCDTNGSCQNDDLIESVKAAGNENWVLDCRCKERDNYPYKLSSSDYFAASGYAEGAKGIESVSCSDNDDMYVKYTKCKRGFSLSSINKCGVDDIRVYLPYSFYYYSATAKQNFVSSSYNVYNQILPHLTKETIWNAGDTECWQESQHRYGMANPQNVFGSTSYSRQPDCTKTFGDAEVFYYSYGNNSYTNGTAKQYDVYMGYKTCPSDGETNTPYHVRATGTAAGYTSKNQRNGDDGDNSRRAYACYGVCYTNDLGRCRTNNFLFETGSGALIGFIYRADETKLYLMAVKSGESKTYDAAVTAATTYAPAGITDTANYGAGKWALIDANDIKDAWFGRTTMYGWYTMLYTQRGALSSFWLKDKKWRNVDGINTSAATTEYFIPGLIVTRSGKTTAATAVH